MRVNPVSNSIYFHGGLKKNLRQGEVVLHDFKENYPYIASSTYWKTRLNRVEDKRNIFLFDCEDVIIEYEKNIRKLRRELDRIEDKGKRQKVQSKEVLERKFGNCGEITDIISGQLNEMGIPHKNLGFRIRGKMHEMPSDHVFNVIWLRNNANAKDPSSWGNKAVIIDGWMNFVLSVPDAIKEYEKFFDAKYKKGDQKYDSDFNFNFKECI